MHDYRRELARLRFEGSIEREFLGSYFRGSLWVARTAMIAALGAFELFLWLDVQASAEVRLRQNELRLIGMAGIAVIFGLSYTRLVPRFYEFLSAALLLFVGLIALLIGSWDPDPGRATTVFIVIILFVGYTMSRMRTLMTVGTCLCLTLGYFAAAAFFVPVLQIGITQTVIFLTTVNGFGALAAYTLERSLRTDFILKRQLDEERARADGLLANMLPAAVAEKLKRRPEILAERHDDVTVLFADIVDFTPLSAQLSPEDTVGLLNRIFSTFDRLAEDHGLEKIKTVGDAYMAVSGLNLPEPDHAARAMGLALAMIEAARQVEREPGMPLSLRIGLNSGPVVAGVIGVRRLSYDLWGDTVNVASRMESHGVEGLIQATESTYNLLKESFAFELRGEIDVKGKGPMRVFVHRPQ